MTVEWERPADVEASEGNTGTGLKKPSSLDGRVNAGWERPSEVETSEGDAMGGHKKPPSLDGRVNALAGSGVENPAGNHCGGRGTGPSQMGRQESRKTTDPEPTDGTGPQHLTKDGGGRREGIAWDKEIGELELGERRQTMPRLTEGC